jgi:CCR4-NOT transcription complex subunit 4
MTRISNGRSSAPKSVYLERYPSTITLMQHRAKADVAAQARKKAAARQKEAERRKEETQNRKHLAGLRVLQKNLVYVVGMSIPGSEDHVLETLRGPNHFGQYGPIIKILVSKTKEGQPLGIYVTFVNKEDAATCISALDGVQHEGRALRAQYGTTKYCSAFLRNENCNNRNCMFLHETGEDSDSFSRQDLSSFNALSSQRSANKADALHPPRHQPPVQQSVQSAGSRPAAQTSTSSKPDTMSRSDSGEGSALPTTASWAKNPQVEQSKKSGQATSRSTPSPKAAQAKTATSRPQSSAAQRPSKETSTLPTAETSGEESAVPSRKPQCLNHPAIQRLGGAFEYLNNSNLDPTLDRGMFDADTLQFIDNCPQLIDPTGGPNTAWKRQRMRMLATRLGERKGQAGLGGDEEEQLVSGSLQLGGEPDPGDEPASILGGIGSNRRQYASPLDIPQSFANQGGNFDFPSALAARSLTPQQQRTISLLKSNSTHPDTSLEQFQRPAGSQHQSQLSNPFQSQNQELSNLARHGRQSSRYTFTSDHMNSSTAIKPTASTQMLMHQTAGQSKQFTSQAPAQSSIYTNTYSNIQGPPPGLKSSGTPPISGGGMFGQGHGFTSGVGGFASHGIKGNNEDIMRDMLRSRGGAGAGAPDMAKRMISLRSW